MPAAQRRVDARRAPPADAARPRSQRSVDVACFANGGPSANLPTARIEERLLHRHRAFKDADRGASLVVTEAIAARSISLPLANCQPDADIARIGAVARTP